MAILGQRRGAQGAVELTTVGAATTGRVPAERANSCGTVETDILVVRSKRR